MAKMLSAMIAKKEIEGSSSTTTETSAVVDKKWNEGNTFGTDDDVVLINGVTGFEVKSLCCKLEKAGIPFSLCQVGGAGWCGVKLRTYNAVSRLTEICNAFSNAGLNTCYQVTISAEDYENAKRVLGIREECEVPPHTEFDGVVKTGKQK